MGPIGLNPSKHLCYSRETTVLLMCITEEFSVSILTPPNTKPHVFTLNISTHLLEPSLELYCRLSITQAAPSYSIYLFTCPFQLCMEQTLRAPGETCLLRVSLRWRARGGGISFARNMGMARSLTDNYRDVLYRFIGWLVWWVSEELRDAQSRLLLLLLLFFPPSVSPPLSADKVLLTGQNTLLFSEGGSVCLC